jgi:TP901 family phage tail tape measure protein
MAIAAVLDIVFRAQTTKAEQGIARTQARLKSFATSVAKAAAAFAAFRGVVGSFGATARLERNLAKSTALVLDLTDAQKELLKQQALFKGLDPNIAAGAAEIAQGYEFLFLAGLDVEKAFLSIERVAKFATAGSFDLARATDLATDTLSAMGLSAQGTAEYLQNLDRVTDAYALAASTANATIEQFAEALLNQAAGQLRLFNKSIEEGLAILAAYANAGVKGTEAGTKLAVALRDLARSATVNATAFERAGIAVFDQAGQFRNFADVLGDLENKLGNLSDIEKIQVLQDLGIPFKSLSAIATLLGQSEQIRKYQEALENAEDVVNRMAAKTMPEFDKALKRVSAAWTVLNSALITPVLEAFAASLNAIVDGLSTTTGKIVAWISLTAVLTPAIAKLVPLLLTLAKALANVAKGAALVSAFSGGLKGLATTVAAAAVAGGIILAIDSQFDAIESQVQAFEELANAQQDLSEASAAATENAAKLNDAINQTGDAIDSQNQKMAELTQRAAAIVERSLTPWQRYLRTLREIREVAGAGLLDSSQYLPAIQKAFDEFNSATQVTIAAPTGAARGSQEAAAKLYGRQLQKQTDISREQLEAQRASQRTLELIRSDLQQTAQQPRANAELGN